MPSSVSAQRLSGASTTSAPHGRVVVAARAGTASNASSLACPPGPWPQSWPSAIASVRATLSPTARAIAVATWATSRAWVSRVRWWSVGEDERPGSCRPAAGTRSSAGSGRGRARSRCARGRAPRDGPVPGAAARVAPGRRLSALARLAQLPVDDRAGAEPSARSRVGADEAAAGVTVHGLGPGAGCARSRPIGRRAGQPPEIAELGVTARSRSSPTGVVQPALGQRDPPRGEPCRPRGLPSSADRERGGGSAGRADRRARRGWRPWPGCGEVTADRESLEVPGHVLAQVACSHVLAAAALGEQLGVPAHRSGPPRRGPAGLRTRPRPRRPPPGRGTARADRGSRGRRRPRRRRSASTIASASSASQMSPLPSTGIE